MKEEKVANEAHINFPDVKKRVIENWKQGTREKTVYTTFAVSRENIFLLIIKINPY